MLEEVVVIVSAEERLDSNSIVNCSNGYFLLESAKNWEQQSFGPVNKSSFLTLLQMVFKRKFQPC